MKKSGMIAVIALAMVITGCVSLTRTATDLPDISKFEAKVTCKDEYSPIKSVKVKVDIYLLDKNENASYNEIVTVITMMESGKQFAGRNIIEDADEYSYTGNIAKIKTSRRVYIKSGLNWQEIKDHNQYLAKVVKAAPKEYLRDYRFTNLSEPTNNWEAYKNLLSNAGCSLHGPVG